MEKEFKYFGVSIERLSLSYAIFLIAWGLMISAISDSDSFTSYIPSFLGLILLLFSTLAILIPSKKKLFMHIVVLFGFIIFLGGLDVFRSFDNLFDNLWADVSKFMLLITGLWFTVVNINSFKFIRKNRNN